VTDSGYISSSQQPGIVKRHLELKQNNAKQIQNKPKTTQNFLFWVCFRFVTCETKRWNKTEVGVAYLSKY